MNIIVCVKQILDPELPAAKFKLDTKTSRVIPPEGLPPVINPFDAQAVELALRLKEDREGKITALTVDESGSDKVIRHALAMGADEGIVVHDRAFEGSDGFSTAHILAKAIEKIGNHDLILCGRQAADWDEGITGAVLAEMLGLPLVTLAAGIEVIEEKLNVKRVTLDGYQVFSVSAPAVVTVSNEVGQPRLASGWGIIKANKARVPVWSGSDIGVDDSRVGKQASRRRLVRLFIPERERKCEVMEGETAAGASARLAKRLREEGII